MSKCLPLYTGEREISQGCFPSKEIMITIFLTKNKKQTKNNNNKKKERKKEEEEEKTSLCFLFV